MKNSVGVIPTLFFDLPLGPFGVEAFPFPLFHRDRRTEGQMPPVIQQKLIDLVILGFGTEGDLTDGAVTCLDALVKGDPKRLLEADGDGGAGVFHRDSSFCG